MTNLRHFIHLFRAFFPSWKFFEDVGHTPHILVRYGPYSCLENEWAPLLRPLNRSFLQLFFAPKVNLYHAYNNHLHHFLAEVMESSNNEELMDSVGYKLTVGLVRFELEQVVEAREAKFFQFKIQVSAPENPEETTDILTSHVMELGNAHS